jgi:hypothetical protein
MLVGLSYADKTWQKVAAIAGIGSVTYYLKEE